MFFWLVLSFIADCVLFVSVAALVGLTCLALSNFVVMVMTFFERRPWLRLAMRHPRVVWYWLLSWRSRRRNSQRARANERPVRQEDIGGVLFGRDPTMPLVERVEYCCWNVKGSRAKDSVLAVYNLDTSIVEPHVLTFPARALYAMIRYRYNHIGYVALVGSEEGEGVDAATAAHRQIGPVVIGGNNFIYDIASGDPAVNEAVERVFGPYGTYRGLPAHLFDYLSRFGEEDNDNDDDSAGGGGGGGGVVIVRGLQRSFLLDQRTQAIQPFQGSMDDERVEEPPMIFYGLAQSVASENLLAGEQ